MFDTLTPPEADKILKLMAMFAADERPEKVDLGVGVYRTPDGRTPVMKAVKQAEERIWQSQESKSYVGLAGDPGFHHAMGDLILGDTADPTRVAAIATPGGTGAVRQIMELMRNTSPDATLWISDPSWPNHMAIAQYLRLNVRRYRYYDVETGGLDRDGMMADLASIQRGDLVLFHGCCHNPSGAELTAQDWRDLGALLDRTGAIPFIDIAYQGFGEGLDEDAEGTRILAQMLPEVLIAASCSKNFGLYRDRAGVAFALASGEEAKGKAQAALASLNRQNYSFPPDHGARVVDTILHDPELAATWWTELTAMREGMLATRAALTQALQAETGSDRFGFLASHRGMFSLIGATPDQVETLRNDHAIYVVGDGRMNVAGLTPASIPKVAKALAQVLT